jgi:hypothetical protein
VLLVRAGETSMAAAQPARNTVGSVQVTNAVRLGRLLDALRD